MIGRLLRSVRAGETNAAREHTSVQQVSQSIHLSSPEFGPGDPIPVRFAGRGIGSNISPPLQWHGAPEGSVELALVVEHSDAPLPRPFVHAVVAGIDPSCTDLLEGVLSNDSPLSVGRTSAGQLGDVGPRPVSGHGPHSYLFQLFALDERLELGRGFTKRQLLDANVGPRHCKGKAQWDV